MKLNKSSILALMTLGGLMAFGQLASADDSTTKPVPPPDAPSTPPSDATPPAGARGGRGGAMNLDRLSEQLKLTDDQKEKVKPVLKDMGDKMRALRQDSSLSPEDRRPKMKEIRDAADTKMKEILSADQYAQWQKMAQARGGRRRNANPPADSSTTPPATNDNK